jgi:hypothetical protein
MEEGARLSKPLLEVLERMMDGRRSAAFQAAS